MKIKDITEAITKAPNTSNQRKYLKVLFQQPLTASCAIDRISKVIQDESLFDEINTIEDLNFDCRNMLQQWISLNMPHLYAEKNYNPDGVYSAISGHPEDMSDIKY